LLTVNLGVKSANAVGAGLSAVLEQAPNTIATHTLANRDSAFEEFFKRK
jgi:hypothetical protein